MQTPPIEGLIAATFAPFDSDGALHCARIPAMVDQLVAEGVGGLFVSGTTGEGESLTFEERCEVAAAYVTAAAGRLPVIVQVGRQSLREARQLAAQAATVGADAIAAAAPAFFKPAHPEALAASMAEIAGGAPQLPFYYYHIPRLTGAPADMPAFLRAAESCIPNLRGIKFSDANVYGFQECARDPRYDLLWGVDEMLLTGLTHGARGAIGSTYNFAAPLFRRILAAHAAGDLAAAQREQQRAVEFIDILIRHRGVPSFKVLMAMIGFDCGDPRLPLIPLSPAESASLRAQLDRIGFFDWGRH